MYNVSYTYRRNSKGKPEFSTTARPVESVYRPLHQRFTAENSQRNRKYLRCILCRWWVVVTLLTEITANQGFTTMESSNRVGKWKR